MKEDIMHLLEQAPELIAAYAIKIVIAIAIYFVGKWLAKIISSLLEKTLRSRYIDITVIGFTRNIIYYVLITLTVIAALGQLGVQTASFVAVIGAAGLAVGLALQGSLANFAAGVLLILFRPIRINDFVEAGGAAGVVTDISIFSTVLTTPDNKRITIANANIMSGNITNYSALPVRRVDLTVGVSYSANIDLVKSTLDELARQDSRIIADKGITIGLVELADSSVNFVFRVWVNTEHYWNVYFDLNEAVKRTFDKKGIQIPFPQMDVHLSRAS